jgi:hypothetical protein
MDSGPPQPTATTTTALTTAMTATRPNARETKDEDMNPPAAEVRSKLVCARLSETGGAHERLTSTRRPRERRSRERLTQDPDAYWQVYWTQSRLPVPPHGSPKTPLVAGTLHVCWPTQAAITIETLFVASHVPSVKAPHVPLGVP